MEDFKRKTSSSEQPGESSYPASVEKMSEKWREIQKQDQDGEKTGFVERNYLAIGIGIGVLIIAFLVVIGGFAFLVWNAR
jgi:hypothetical protein